MRLSPWGLVQRFLPEGLLLVAVSAKTPTETRTSVVLSWLLSQAFPHLPRPRCRWQSGEKFVCLCLLPDLSFMEENGIYRIIFKNKVKAELSEKYMCVCVS